MLYRDYRRLLAFQIRQVDSLSRVVDEKLSAAAANRDDLIRHMTSCALDNEVQQSIGRLFLTAYNYTSQFTASRSELVQPSKEYRYVRSEPAHPYHESSSAVHRVLQELIELLSSDNLGDVEELAAFHVLGQEELARLIQNLEHVQGQIAVKMSKKGGDTWLGQKQTASEVLEHAYRQLPPFVVYYIYKKLLADKKAQIEEQLVLLAQRVGSDDLQTGPKASAGQDAGDDEEDVFVVQETDDLSFTSIMRAREQVTVRARDAVSATNGLRARRDKGTVVNFLPVVADTDYLCLTFDIRPILQVLGLEVLDRQAPTDMVNAVSRFLTSSFTATMNTFAMVRHNDDEMIWTAIQASFGSIRPTFSDTGRAIRLSMGIVPPEYIQILEAAHVQMLDLISIMVADERFKALFGAAKTGPVKAFQNPHFLETWQLIMMDLLTEKIVDANDADRMEGLHRLSDDMLRILENEALRFSKNKNRRNAIRAEVIENIHRRKERLRQGRALEVLSDVPAVNDLYREVLVLITSKESLVGALIDRTKDRGSFVDLVSLNEFALCIQAQLNELVVRGRMLPARGAYTEKMNYIEEAMVLAKSCVELEIYYDYLREYRGRIDEAHQHEHEPSILLQQSVGAGLDDEEEADEADADGDRTPPMLSRESSHADPDSFRRSASFGLLSQMSGDDGSVVTGLTKTTSVNRFGVRSGMDGLVQVYSEIIQLVHQAWLKSRQSNEAAGGHAADSPVVCTADEVYFEMSEEIIHSIAEFAGIRVEPEIMETLDLQHSETVTGDDVTSDRQLYAHLLDVRPFPRVGANAMQPRSEWLGDWSTIHESRRPKVLIVDITSATQDDIDDLCRNFWKKRKQDLPAIMLFVESENKYGQVVDLSCSGTISILKNTNDLDMVEFASGLQLAQHIRMQSSPISVRAMRRIQEALGTRRSLRSLAIINQKLEHYLQKIDEISTRFTSEDTVNVADLRELYRYRCELEACDDFQYMRDAVTIRIASEITRYTTDYYHAEFANHLNIISTGQTGQVHDLLDSLSQEDLAMEAADVSAPDAASEVVVSDDSADADVIEVDLDVTDEAAKAAGARMRKRK